VYVPTKYGVQRDFYFVMIKRAVLDFAVAADWSPQAGDVKVSIDGAAEANATNLPTAPASTTGLWKITMSAAQLTGKIISVIIRDAAPKAVEDQSLVFATYGHASAAFPRDIEVAEQLADVRKWLNTAVGAPTVAGVPLVEVSSFANPPGIKKNATFSNFPFYMELLDGSPGTGLTVTATRSIDGAAFGSCANSVVEMTAGAYKIDLAATDLNGGSIMFKFTATGAKPTIITVIPEP